MVAFVLGLCLVLASVWMTRERGELAIANNAAVTDTLAPSLDSARKSPLPNVLQLPSQIQPLDVRLAGVMVTADGKASLALVSVNNLQESIVRVGESLGGHAIVIGIENDSMTYRQGEVTYKTTVQSKTNSPVSLAQMPPPTSNPSSTAAEAVRLPGFMPVPQTTRPINNEQPNGNAAFKRDLEKRLANLKEQP